MRTRYSQNDRGALEPKTKDVVPATGGLSINPNYSFASTMAITSWLEQLLDLGFPCIYHRPDETERILQPNGHVHDHDHVSYVGVSLDLILI